MGGEYEPDSYLESIIRKQSAGVADCLLHLVTIFNFQPDEIQ